MVTLANRLMELRSQKGVSRPELAAALGLPRTSIEKFETGRQTPTQAQQERLASYFGVSLFYLRGESTDRTQMSDWMDGAFMDEPSPVAPTPRRQAAKASQPDGDSGTVYDALAGSKRFQESLRAAVIDALKSPEGQELLGRAIRQELLKRK